MSFRACEILVYMEQHFDVMAMSEGVVLVDEDSEISLAIDMVAHPNKTHASIQICWK